MSLLHNLTFGSALMSAIQGGRHHIGWTVEAYLLAETVDALHNANWQRGGGRGSRPKPVERPDKVRTTKVVRVADILKAQKKR